MVFKVFKFFTVFKSTAAQFNDISLNCDGSLAAEVDFLWF